MASLQKKYSNEKLKGQIFTPFFIVDKILDDINYNSADILGQTILDPACGDGRFLIKIAERIIKFSKPEKLKENLENIYGWDTDELAINEAKVLLNKVISKSNIVVNWNIKVADALQQKDLKFDFIVGNPPYIRIQHLDIEQRKFIQDNFEFCKSGSTDIYIAFYELAIKLLNKNGVCGFITPNTFFNTETAKPLRTFFEKEQNLLQISNYGAIQLFDNATTYSSITIFDIKKNKNFLFQNAVSKTEFEERNIDFSEIKNQKFWQLSIKKIDIKNGKRLGDIANIHVGLTTLADRIYIMKFVKEEKNYIFLKNKASETFQIEKEILKPIIKVSTLKKSDEPITEYIIFPYKKTTPPLKQDRVMLKTQIIPEKELKEKYPFAYKYLLSQKDILDKRDNGKPNKVAWYAYGRSQGFETSFGEKIVFSPMNKKPNFIYIKNTESTFYSGYCIKYDGDYKKLLDELNSERMKDYISISARDFRGGWKAYNKKIVQEFVLSNY